MPDMSQTFQLLPWKGGVNTSLDPALIEPGQLVQGDNIVFGFQYSKRQREGIKHNWDDATSTTNSVIGLKDFWYGAAAGKTQKAVAVHDSKAVYTHTVSSGARSADLFAGTAWGSTITQCSMETLNNLMIIAVDGASNVMKKYSGSGNIADLGGTPPVASICREHLGRLWTNDKTNVDRLHYSTTANPEEWTGAGDSGAIDIGVGDGDPEGITAIFPTFKGDLFVAKKTKLYRLSGYSPEEWQVELVSNGVGCVSHNAITTADQDDIYFLSEKGVHSLKATQAYGDFEGAFVSLDIQKTFNDKFTKSRLKFADMEYLSAINSIALAITDESIASSQNRAIWLYNIPQKSWYRWPDISCASIAVLTDSDFRKRLFLGTNTGRVSKAFNAVNYDISAAGVNTAIVYTIKTGIMFPDNSPNTVKGIKRFGLIYRPEGSHTIVATVKVDNYSNQNLVYTQSSSAALLGTTFILGTSVLGLTYSMLPYSLTIDGYGRGVQVTISSSTVDSLVDLQGLMIEWEPAGSPQEIILSESA